MLTPEMILTKRNKTPQDEDEVLVGIRNLWERIVEKLSDAPEMLLDLERSLNDSLRKPGAWGSVKIADGTYLNLLESMIVRGTGGGQAPERIWTK